MQGDDDGQEGWGAEVEEIERLRDRARLMGGEERIDRQHARGKRTARERMEQLFDPGTFEEIGILADHSSVRPNLKDFYAAADGVITGAGDINGRPAYAFAEDFTVLGGTTGRTGGAKRNRLKDMAGRERVPGRPTDDRARPPAGPPPGVRARARPLSHHWSGPGPPRTPRSPRREESGG